MASILTPAKSLVTVTAADDNSLQSPKFLGDLGKPTLRGVRKCDKCGTFNGTRGTRCKNKLCDQVFKVMEKKKGTGPESVKLLTGKLQFLPCMKPHSFNETLCGPHSLPQ